MENNKPNTGLAVTSFLISLITLLWIPIACCIPNDMWDLSLLMLYGQPVACLILSILGIVFANSSKNNGNVSGFAVAGQVISIICLVFVCIEDFFIVFTWIFAASIISSIFHGIINLLTVFTLTI